MTLCSGARWVPPRVLADQVVIVVLLLYPYILIVILAHLEPLHLDRISLPPPYLAGGRRGRALCWGFLRGGEHMNGSTCRGESRRSTWVHGRQWGWRSEKGIEVRGEETRRGSRVGGIERRAVTITYSTRYGVQSAFHRHGIRLHIIRYQPIRTKHKQVGFIFTVFLFQVRCKTLNQTLPW